MKSFLRPSPFELQLFLFGIVASVVAKGVSLFALSFNIDDLWYWQVPFNFDTVGQISFRDGRFSFPIIAAVADYLSINLPRAPTLSGSVLLACQVISGIILCRIWRITSCRGASVIVVSVISTHPYMTDIYTWKMSMFTGGIPFALVLAAVLMSRDRWGAVPASAGIVVVSLGVHQIPLQWATVTALFSVAFSLVEAEAWQDVRARAVEVGRMGTALTLGTALYWLLARSITSWFGVLPTLGRERIILLSDPGLVWARLRELCTMMVYRDPLISTPQRALLLATFFIALVGCIGIGYRRKSKSLTVGSAVLLFGVTGLGLLSSAALTVITGSWVPVFRNLSAISVIWAAIPSLAYQIAPVRLRYAILGAVALMVFGFTGKSNEILIDQLRANARDRALISMVAVDLARLPRFEDTRRLAFVGTTAVPLRGLSTAADLSTGWHSYGTTLSAFAVPWDGYLVQLLNESTGRSIVYVEPEERRKIGDPVCEGSDFFPAPSAYHIVGDTAVVCIGRPQQVIVGPLDGP